MAAKNIVYNAAPVAAQFHNSKAFVRGLRGPIGSGKSVACCIEIFKKSREQAPSPDGIRKTRWLVVRNTLPQLETTTIKTWLDWFPTKDFGRMTGKPPYTHYIKYGDVDMEVIFIALDKPEDVKKLLSFECTGIWFNEAREINKEIVDAATGRVGRYPSAKDGGCTWSGIIMDTNPPDDSHWWYNLAEESTPENWSFFTQPSGLSPDAENLENLNQPSESSNMSFAERRLHGAAYYTRMLGGKTQEWINVYVHGKYGFIKDGKPVYEASWNEDLHGAKYDIPIIPTAEISCGIDASGRNPAAVFGQRTPLGQIQIIHELVCEGIGAVAFAELLRSEVLRVFPNNEIEYWGDPAGAFGSQNDEKTYFDILREKAGIRIRPAPTSNKIGERIQTVESVLLRLVSGGVPAYLVSRACKLLRRGFNGGYKYKRMSVSGGARYDDKPDKSTRFADVHDANQYLLLGMGEGNRMKGLGKNKHTGAITAKVSVHV